MDGLSRPHSWPVGFFCFVVTLDEWGVTLIRVTHCIHSLPLYCHFGLTTNSTWKSLARTLRLHYIMACIGSSVLFFFSLFSCTFYMASLLLFTRVLGW